MTLVNPTDREAYRFSDASDLHQLWWAEFGDSYEVVARVGAILAATAGLWFYNGWLIGIIWAACYLAALSFAYFALRPSNPTHPAAWALGIGSFILAGLIFVSFPLLLLTAGDIVLTFCAALTLVGLGVFTLFRNKTPAIIQPYDIAIGWIVIGVVASTYVPGQATIAAQGFMLLLCVVVGGYYTHALITSRNLRRDLHRAAEAQHEAQKMEAIGRLSGGFAHDFNNILTALQGSLELYHEVPNGPERDALVNDARSAGARATGLVSQLLAFAQRAHLTPRPYDAGLVLHDLLPDARAALGDGITIETRQLPTPVNVMADTDGLHSALMNVLRNSAEVLGNNGAVTLAVDLAQGPASEGGSAPAETPIGAHLVFSVADDGPGMAPSILARATEPFFTTKSVGKGSGLGLSMALGFAEQSGGTLRIKSSDDGTIVALHLPIAAT